MLFKDIIKLGKYKGKEIIWYNMESELFLTENFHLYGTIGVGYSKIVSIKSEVSKSKVLKILLERLKSPEYLELQRVRLYNAYEAL